MHFIFMAPTKVPTRNVVSFIELRKRCPKDQIHQLDKMHAKHKQYQARLNSLKSGPPPIDWDYYKRNVRSEAVSMVEEFEKKYENFTIPYPEDKYSKQIDDLKVEVQNEVTEFINKSNERIAAYEKEIERIRSMIPFDQMTWEDYCLLYPECAPDFINRPTFWPHNAEEQIGYIEPSLNQESAGEKVEVKKEIKEVIK